MSREVETGEVHALSNRYFASTQFHAESLLTRDGVRITADRIASVLLDPPEMAPLAS